MVIAEPQPKTHGKKSTEAYLQTTEAGYGQISELGSYISWSQWCASKVQLDTVYYPW